MICRKRATKMTCADVYEGDRRNGKSHGSRVGNHTAEEAEDHRHHRGDGDDAVAAATHAPFSDYRLLLLPTPLGLAKAAAGTTCDAASKGRFALAAFGFRISRLLL
jgi:hypothetical protein